MPWQCHEHLKMLQGCGSVAGGRHLSGTTMEQCRGAELVPTPRSAVPPLPSRPPAAARD